MAADRKRDRNKRPDDAGSKTKKQLIIVGLLVVGLVLALVTQPEKTEVVADIQPTVTLTELKPEAIQNAGVNEPQDSVLQVQSLESIELQDWVDQNPFAASQAETRNKSFSDANGFLRIQAVYGQGNSAVALIGSHLVHVGETLPDGRRVLSITADGIELSR